MTESHDNAKQPADHVDSPSFLFEGLTTRTGEEFFAWLAEFLAATQRVEYVVIGELTGEDWDRIRTLVVRTTGGIVENIDYDLVGTPCSTVVGKAPCAYACDVARDFPDDILLKELGAESYVGVPLMDTSGRPLGLIVLLDTKAMSKGRVDHANRALELFRPRAEAELEKRRTLREYNVLLAAAGRRSSKGALESLTLSMAHALHVKVAWIATFAERDHRRHEIAALSVSGQNAEPFDYPIEGTPCAGLGQEQVALLTSNAQQAFPNATCLSRFGAEAVLCIALTGTDGVEYGHLVLLHDRPLNDRLGSQPLLKVFAHQITAELERRAAEDRRLEMEKKILASQRMESLGALAGGVAHDFNNLLAGILGNTELAIHEVHRREDVVARLQKIEDAAGCAAELCRQLLDYAGRRSFDSSTFALNDLVEEMGGLLRVSIPKNVDLDLDFMRPSPLVAGDAIQIRQIVMNQITNASDAIGSGRGRIQLRTRIRAMGRIDLDGASLAEWLEPGNYAVLEVTDSGCGMDSATVQRIFDPFFTTKEKGHGLGLAAVIGIVRSHGGAITVQSEPGRGSTFTSFLPLAVDAIKPLDSEPAPAPAIRRGKSMVLVADDDQVVRDVAREMLELAGYSVLVAKDGHDALNLFKENVDDISCALVDLTMPGMDGIETVRAVRKMRPDVGIVLASGYPQRTILDRMDDGEIDEMVTKPFTREVLLDRVETALAAYSSRFALQ